MSPNPKVGLTARLFSRKYSDHRVVLLVLIPIMVIPILPTLVLAQTLTPCNTTIFSNTVLSTDISGCVTNGLNIGASNVILDCQRHTITGTGINVGISAGGQQNIEIRNCIINNFNEGIGLYQITNSRVINDTTLNTRFAIGLYQSSSNTLKGNLAVNTTQNAFGLDGGSNYNILTNDTADKSGATGFIILRNSNYNFISESTAKNGDQGYLVLNGTEYTTLSYDHSDYNRQGFSVYSNYNTLFFNTVKNATSGYFLAQITTPPSHNYLTDNLAVNSTFPFTLNFAVNNTLFGNLAFKSGNFGFNLQSSSFNTLEENVAQQTQGNGFQLGQSSRNNTLTKNISYFSKYNGYNLDSSLFNSLINNTAHGGGGGFNLSDSSFNTLSSCTAYLVTQGYSLGYTGHPANHNFLLNNRATNTSFAFTLTSSSNNMLDGNKATNTTINGFQLNASPFNTITNNAIKNAGRFGFILSQSSNNALDSNTAETTGAGGFVLFASNSTAMNYDTAAKNFRGFNLVQSSFNSLTYDTATGDLQGFTLSSQSNFNTLSYDTAYNNTIADFNLCNSPQGNCSEDNMTLTNNLLSYDTAYNSIYGYILQESDNNTLSNNIAYTDTIDILLSNSANSTLTGNRIIALHTPTVQEEGLLVASGLFNNVTDITDFRNQIPTSNTINTLPILYIDGQSKPCPNGTTYTNGSSYGYMGFVGCSNIGIVNSAPSDQILLAGTTSSTIANLSMCNTLIALVLEAKANNNVIANNTITNNFVGLGIANSTGNHIYNNFFSNRINAQSNGLNDWNTTKTLGTNIVGGPFIGGNYWSNYNGTDTDNDGIGDNFVPYYPGGATLFGGDYLPLVLSHDFSMSTDTPSVNVDAGSVGSFNITLTSLRGSNTVTLTVDSSPSGLTVCTPQTLIVTTTIKFACSFSSSSPNLYTLTVTGRDGLITHQIMVKIRVFDFAIQPDTSSIITDTGTTGNSTLTISSSQDPTRAIALTVSTFPVTGLDCSLSQSTIIGSGTSILSCSGPAGTYTVTVYGTGGKITHSITLTYTIQDFALAANRTHLYPDAGAVAEATIGVTGADGFAKTVDLSLSIAPSIGMTCNLSATSVIPEASATLVCVGSAGSYTVVVIGQEGSLSRVVSVNIVVYSPPQPAECGGSNSCSIRSDWPITDIRFAGNTLHFTATGPSGVVGHTNVTIPASSLPHIQQLKVFVDNTPLPLTAYAVTTDSTGTIYYVSFSFIFHSPTNIDIQLSTPPNQTPSTPTPAIFGLDPMLFYALIAGLAVVAAAVAVFTIRRMKPMRAQSRQ